MSDRPTEDKDKRRGQRPSAESVRIIGADEAAAAIEAGQAAGRRPDDAPRFGDVPAAPEGPRPPLRFPMPGSDPSSVSKPAIAGVPASPEDLEDEAYLEGLSTMPPDEPEAWTSDDGWTASDDDWEADDQPLAVEDDRWGPDVDYETEEPAEPPADSPTLVTPAGGVELPHWTEPGTGEVPAILGDAEPAAADEPVETDDIAWSTFTASPRWRDTASDWEEPDFEAGAALSDDETRVGALDTGQTDYSDIYSFDEPEPPLPPRGAAPPPPVAAEPPPPPSMPPPSPSPAAGAAAAAYEPIAEPVSTGRDLPVAIGAGLALGAAVLIAAKVGAAAVLVLGMVVLVAATFELYETLRTRGYHPATLLGLVGTLSMSGAVYWKGETAIPLVLGLFIVFTFLWYLGGVVHARPAMNVAVTVMAFLYVGFLGAFGALLLRIPGVTTSGGRVALAHDGITLFLLPVVATVAYDVGAYFVGSRTGRTPLAPAISPGKTWEGLAGATIATFIVTELVVAIFHVHPWTYGKAFWLAVVVSIAAPLGDLSESMIKRDLGVKDMGTILPGHGGILDRIDALLFVLPATYYLLRVLDFV